MNPVLYESTESTFETNGLGVLSDTISCQVVEERNGIFEITLEYPLTGIHYQEIKQRRIIFIKPNPYEDPQPFRIYRITKPLSLFTRSTSAMTFPEFRFPPFPPAA